MAQRRKQSVISGATVLMAATLIVKLIGALYKIPLSSLLGEVGYGYFSGAYNIYTYVYTISMAGFPVAVARMVSEYVASNRLRSAKQVFRVSKLIFLCTGVFGTLLLFSIAMPYANYIKAPPTYVSIFAIAPCIFFCCMMSAYRGYYQGLRNMFPTAISQVIEAVGKLGLGLGFSYFILQLGLKQFAAAGAGGTATVFGAVVASQDEALEVIAPYTAAGAIFGVTLGSLFGLLYLVIMNRVKGSAFTREELVNSPESESGKSITKALIKIAIPIAVGSLIYSLSNLIDDVTINRRLVYAMSKDIDAIKNMYAYSLNLSHTQDDKISTYLFGVYNVVLNLKNFVPTILLTLGTSAVPALAESWSSKNTRDTRITIESVIRLSMIVALPAGLGMSALAEPIIRFLYVDLGDRASLVPVAAPILTVCGLGMAFFSVAAPLTNMLQAVGRTDVPIKSVIIGSAAKLSFNYILIGNPAININGAAVSTIISYVLMVGINIFYLLRETKVRISVTSVLLKPLLAGVLCGAAAWSSHGLINIFITQNNVISLFASIIIGGLVYVSTLLLVRGIAKDDIFMLPKGEKIAKVLEKFGVLG